MSLAAHSGSTRVFAVLVGSAVALGGCIDPSGTHPRAVVIGIDGADWRVIDRLVEAGRMPHLATLRARGISGPIETLPDIPLSPVVWTSVATGVTPEKHGVTWFLVDQPDGTRAPVRSHNRRRKALWNLVSEQERRPVSVGWWASYPAEAVGEGVIVSDALGFHGFGRSAQDGDDQRKTWPPALYREMDALVPPDHQISFAFASRFLHVEPDEYRVERFDPVRHARRDAGNPVHLFQQYAATAQGYTAIAEELLEREPYDLFLVYYEQVDSFSHLFMKYAPPQLEWLGDADFARYRDVVTEWYAYQDELLGRLLAKIDLDETAVFVLSDHGFKSGGRRIRSEQTIDLRTAHLDHESDGIFLAAGPGIRRGERVEGASVVDVTPTLLHYLDLPVGKDMDGRVLTEIFAGPGSAARPVRYVSSYESGEPEREAPQLATYGDAELAESLEGLAALGYVEPSAGSAAPEHGESSPEIHLNLARIHLRRGELAEATAEFEKTLTLEPGSGEALLGLGAIANQRGDRARAEHWLQRALRSNPDHPLALSQLAALRRDAGVLDDAIRLFREAILIDGVQPELYLGLGDCLQRVGRYKEAEQAFDRVLELDPDSFAAHYNLGVSALAQAHYQHAITRFEAALELGDDHPLLAPTLNNLGTAHLESGDSDRAVARYQEAVRASPGQLEARYNLAAQYLARGRSEEAIGLLESAAELSPNHEAVHIRLGHAYLRAGRGEEAYRSLALVRRLYPDNWFAPLGLAVLHASLGHSDAARPLLEEALKAGGESARAEASGYPALGGLFDAS